MQTGWAASIQRWLSTPCSAGTVLGKSDIGADESEDLAAILQTLVAEGPSAAHGGRSPAGLDLTPVLLSLAPHVVKLQVRPLLSKDIDTRQ